jgi:FKBP-type peptidyl-prolyl cis-trans isomerase
MAQTMNGKKGQKGTPQKQTRPGQRQQERLSRQARRRRRRQIWTSAIVAVVVIALAVVAFLQIQRINQQNADRAAKATATADAKASATASTLAAQASATASANASATAIAEAQNCFMPSTGTPAANIYSAKATPTAGPATPPKITGTPVTLSGGLQYIDIKVGTGPAAKKGSTISAEYTGWVASTCQKFDSSYDNKGQPFSAPLGEGQVIPGWDQGLIGIKAGGTRRLLIPASLAYGANPPQGSNIPPNAVLIFDVTVLSVK